VKVELDVDVDIDVEDPYPNHKWDIVRFAALCFAGS
jgi:hypothetical protein